MYFVKGSKQIQIYLKRWDHCLQEKQLGLLHLDKVFFKQGFHNFIFKHSYKYVLSFNLRERLFQKLGSV